MVSEHASPLAVLGGVDAGGQNMAVASLARALVARGHDVEVFTRRDDPGPAETVTVQARLRVTHVPAGPARVIGKDDMAPFMPAFGAWLRQRWSRGPRPDVVHAHFWMSGLAALVAARPLGLPVVQTFHALGSVKARHQGAADTSPPERVAAERQLARSVDLVLATCTDEVTELRALGTPSGRIRIVPCGVDTEMFRASGPLAARGERFRLVDVGRLVERKGVDTVLRALAAIVRSDGAVPFDAELIVVGGPVAEGLAADPEVRRLRALAADLGIADRVVFTGRLPAPEVAAHYRAADVVVATPWYEPFGLVPLEAMACGAAFVGSAVGGLLDTVRDGECGLLVPPRDPVALAGALRQLAGDQELRHRLGAAARRRALRFETARVAGDTEAAYETLVDVPLDVPLDVTLDVPAPGPRAGRLGVARGMGVAGGMGIAGGMALGGDRAAVDRVSTDLASGEGRGGAVALPTSGRRRRTGST